ncbi:metalloregulator ArsR/SmtB family transcription factor [Streptomyces sp. NPDC026672]|uniref:ArsR/SmtB family transcription factor n=1 Tax=unclassified Streptomyces TaxID=2593676 RepID=UPI003409F4DE
MSKQELVVVGQGSDVGGCCPEGAEPTLGEERAFDLSQPTISHHLKLLRKAGLDDCERRGTWVYYWVLPDTLDRLTAFLTSPGLTAPADSRK